MTKDKNEELYDELVSRTKEIIKINDVDVMVETLKLLSSIENNRSQVERELIRAKTNLDIAIVKCGYRLETPETPETPEDKKDNNDTN